MKQGMQFFRESKPRARVQCHVDGVTIPGLGSLRLSNIPKNLLNMVQSLLCYGIALSVVTVQADDCQSSLNSTQNYLNLFFNNLQNTSSLWFQYDPAYVSTPSNAICNLSLTEQKLGNYSLLDCFCPTTELGKQVNRIILYGYNLPNESANCLFNLISNYCIQSNNNNGAFSPRFILLVVPVVCCLWISTFVYGAWGGREFCYRLNRRHEEKEPLFLISDDSKLIPKSNSILENDYLDQQEPQAENRSWCCLGR